MNAEFRNNPRSKDFPMIRKTLLSACAAVALAGPAFAGATHDIVTQDVFYDTLDFTDGLNTSGPFGVTFGGKGSFDEVFLFFAPPTESQIQFDGVADYFKGKATVSFSGFDFGVFNALNYDGVTGAFLGANVTSLPLDQSYLTRYAFGGESADFLGSGVYYIEVRGTSLAAGAGFGGHINTTAIPEPTNVALLLAGMGLVGGLARRRRQSIEA